MFHLPPEPADLIPDPAVARAERRLRLLERLTEIGMELAEALRERVINPAVGEADAKGRDPADAYARLSRAIRLTIALEEKTDQALADLKAGVVRARQEARQAAARRTRIDPGELIGMQQAKVGYLALDAAKVEIDDEETFGDLCEALDERLEEDEAYWILTDRPLRQIVEQLCRDLELSPDWSQWCDEDQCWAPGYVPVRPRWSAFNTPSRKRILPEDDGEPPPEAEARSAGLWPAASGTPAVQALRQLE